jgi:hypothetical protein
VQILSLRTVLDIVDNFEDRTCISLHKKTKHEANGVSQLLAAVARTHVTVLSLSSSCERARESTASHQVDGGC